MEFIDTSEEKQDRDADKMAIDEMNKRVTCVVCLGDKYQKRNCSHCQGKGYIICKTN